MVDYGVGIKYNYNIYGSSSKPTKKSSKAIIRMVLTSNALLDFFFLRLTIFTLWHPR